jgi:NAD(P)H-dependent FMN reductase
LTEVERLINQMATSPAEGLGYRGTSRIANQLSSLFSSIQGVHAAPTSAQKEFANELFPEATAKVSEVDRFLREQMKKLNESLRQAQLPTIVY